MDGSVLNRQQLLLFCLLFCGYTLYTITRQSLSYNIPNIKLNENVDNEQIGGLTSALALGYAIGKFVSGILVDFASPRKLFSIGLFTCGAINLAFSYVSSYHVLTTLWLLNGLFQGFGWPSCAKLLKRWYNPSLFGTLWSLLSASMNVAAAIGPAFSNLAMDEFGSWRISMRIFGLLSIITSALCFILIRDSFDLPHSEVEDKADVSSEPTIRTDRPTFLNALRRIFNSPLIYIMSYGFMACLFCKGVMSDWVPLYLIMEKNASREMAASFTTAFQIGGITGNISSGAIGDWMKSKYGRRENGHPRNFLLMPLVGLLTLFILFLSNYIDDMPSQYAYVLSLAFAIGYIQFSLISIVGVTVVEISASDISGTSHAVAALFGNVGLIVSGLPFTMVVQNYSWHAAFSSLECILLIWFLMAVMSHFFVFSIGVWKSKSKVE